MRDHDYMNFFWPKGFRAALLSLALLVATGMAQAQTGASPRPAPRAEILTIDQAQALVRSNPQDPSAHLALGSAYRRARKYDEALRSFQKLASLAPNASATH